MPKAAGFTSRSGTAGTYVITDESTAFDMLDEEDAKGVSSVTIREFTSAGDRDAYLTSRGWSTSGPGLAAPTRPPSGIEVRWYGERGVVNSLVNHLSTSDAPVEAVRRLLAAVQWAGPADRDWIRTFTAATLVVEVGLADFGNPDLLIVCNGPDGVRLVFLEAKIVPFVASMRPNSQGMQLPGFNSSINGQIALKYRFAKALETAEQGSLGVVESQSLLAAYSQRLSDSRQLPRRLAKAGIVTDILKPLGLLGLPESQCAYVALTWDTPERQFFSDPEVARADGLPVFLDAVGGDAWPAVSGRVGWLGYALVDEALGVSLNKEYQNAFATMVSTVAPTPDDYATARLINDGAPEAVPLMARLAELFGNYEVVKYPGSYSIKDQGRTIGKISLRANGVFVGLRETTSPERWFPGPLEDVSVNGVTFRGVVVPVDSPDHSLVEALAGGL